MNSEILSILADPNKIAEDRVILYNLNFFIRFII
jgi:hypothetical protein